MSACRVCRCLACECCAGCAERDEVIERMRDALHELECGWWATGDVPEMMEAVRLIVRGTVDRATEGGPWGSPDN